MNEEAIEREDSNSNLEKEKPRGHKRNENDRNNKNNENKSQREKLKTIYILGDSMVKKLNGYLLTKKVKHKYLIKLKKTFSGAKVSCMVDHVKPAI